MTTRYSANVTKLRAGGSGDNYIADGYIKTVEKVWIDTYALASVIATLDTLVIAQIAPGKKITDVIVFFPAITPTSSTINVGTVSDVDKFIDDAAVVRAAGVTAVAPTAVESVRMDNLDGALYVTTGSTLTDIILSIGIAATTAPTVGTITTIVKYT